jgi:hypothetical protein
MAKEKICLYCFKFFTPKNPKGHFCKTSHRVAFHKRKKRRLQREQIKIRMEKLEEEIYGELRMKRQEELEWLRQQQEKEIAEIKRMSQK